MRPAIVFVLLVLGLAVAPAARADGGVTLVGSELRFSSDPQDAEDLVISRSTGSVECGTGPSPCIQFANGQATRDESASCIQLTPKVVSCSPASVTSMSLKLNDGDDFVRVLNDLPPTTIDGGDGADDLDVRTGNDTVLGGAGNDEIVDDFDVLGDDRIDAGAGDDHIELSGGDDDVRGGAGTDTVEMDSGDDTVRLDDVANDGRPGETKNIHTDVEAVDGEGGSDNLFGNAAANTLLGGSGNDLIDGGAGDDVIDGGTGADDMSGGAGTDRVLYAGAGAQTVTLDGVRDDGAAGELDNVRPDIEDVEAGPGNDRVVGSDAANVLDGGAGDDRLDGRGGVDTFAAGPGADTLAARDGLAERVDCGSEADGGDADTTDQLVDCEAVAVSTALLPDSDGDGFAKPGDCNDVSPAVHPGAPEVLDNGVDEDCSGADAVNLDRDRDGFARPVDCDDADAHVHPGAADRPGNRRDEDCRGGDAPFPLLASAIAVTFNFAPRFTVFTQFSVRQAKPRSTAGFRCRGRGCPFKARRLAVKRRGAKVILRNPLRGARLRPGARLEIRLTHRGTIGLVARYTVRAGKAPKRADLCLPPGARRPGRCPR